MLILRFLGLVRASLKAIRYLVLIVFSSKERNFFCSPGQLGQRVLGENCLEKSFVQEVMDVHVDVDHLEVRSAGQQEELDHLRCVPASLLLLLHVAVLAVFVVERQMELGQGSEVLAAGFQDGTVLYLEADDPEEAKLDTVGSDTEEMGGLDVPHLKEEKSKVRDILVMI